MYLTLLFTLILSSNILQYNCYNFKYNRFKLNEELKNEIEDYQPIAEKFMKTILNGKFQNSTYNRLAEFIDKFGSRLSGSENLENAIDYMVERSKYYGLENVRTENVSVPYWIRGEEYATLIKPRYKKLNMLGLGTSVGTSGDGIIAQVIVVKDFNELKQIGQKVAGKIVVFNPEWISYDENVIYRLRAASEGAKFGAVAALVRSITPFSLDTPHTGFQRYEEGVKKIPVACITPADANMLHRMHKRGETIVIKLKMDARNEGYKISRNMIAEIEGTDKKNKIVMLSGHIDSWDVGDGAMDDGAGALLAWNSLVLIKQLGLKPRRTMQVILWTGEEFAYQGSRQYFKKHIKEIDDYNFVMESDMGTFNPRGLEFSGTDEAAGILQSILSLLKPVNMTRLRKPQNGGPDIEFWTDVGVPGASPWNDNEKYFWYHHSNADTMDVEDPHTLDLCTVLWTTVSYIVADLSSDLPKILNLTKLHY